MKERDTFVFGKSSQTAISESATVRDSSDLFVRHPSYNPETVARQSWDAFQHHAEIAQEIHDGLKLVQDRAESGRAWLDAHSRTDDGYKRAIGLYQRLRMQLATETTGYHSSLCLAWLALVRLLVALEHVDSDAQEQIQTPVFVSTDIDEVWRSLMGNHDPFDRAWLHHVLL